MHVKLRVLCLHQRSLDLIVALAELSLDVCIVGARDYCLHQQNSGFMVVSAKLRFHGSISETQVSW